MNMFSATRIMWINGILFLGILALSVIIITEERYLPGEPPIKEVKRQVTELIEADRSNLQSSGGNYESFGKVDMFETIIPLPTRTPTPTPEPPKPPRIEQVTEYWKLSFVFKSMATFQDIKTQEEYTIKVGDKRDQDYKGKTYGIYLDSVDRKNWSCTILMNDMGEVQKRTFRMFE